MVFRACGLGFRGLSLGLRVSRVQEPLSSPTLELYVEVLSCGAEVSSVCV